jgi:hypothetical protein
MAVNVLKDIKETPAKVRVCSGTYTTFVGKKTISENTTLLIRERFTRKVAKVKYFQRKAQKRYAFINLPLRYCCKIGFNHKTSNNILLTNVKEVLINRKMLPKILFVHKTCQCSHHVQNEGDVLLVITVTECSELLVRNIIRLTTYKLTHACQAIISLDPEKACVNPGELLNLSEDSLPWKNVVLKPS